MLSEEQYRKVINWELQHHRKKWFSLFGYTIWKAVTVDDIKNIPDWFLVFTMNSEQHEIWKKKSMKLIKKHSNYSDEYLKRQFGWVDLNHGLRIDNEQPEIIFHHEL